MVVQGKTGRAITVGILLIAAISIIVVLINFTKPDKSEPQIGQSAPNFTLTDLEGKKLSLSDLKGKIVLLNFWGSWCNPCKTEMPDLEQVYQQFKDKGVVVLGVNIGESKVTAKGFADRLGITFPIVLDKDRNITLNQFKIGPIPTTFFIDKKGNIRHIYIGSMSRDYIQNKIQTLLDQP